MEHRTLQEAIDAFDALEADDFDELEDEDDAPDLSKEQQMQLMLNKYRDPNLHKVSDPAVRKLIDEVEALAYSNAADMFETVSQYEQVGYDEDGEPRYQITQRTQLKALEDLPENVRKSIQTIRVKRTRDGGEEVELKLYDKLGALDKLMRYHGAYAKENEQKSKGGEALMDMLFGAISTAGLPEPKNNV